MPAAPVRARPKSAVCASPAPKPADPASLIEGVRVRIFGFGVARKELNGKEGFVAGFDAEKRRWHVELEDGSGRKLFTEDNLEFVEDPHAAARAKVRADAEAKATAEAQAAWETERRRREAAAAQAELDAKAAAAVSAAAQAEAQLGYQEPELPRVDQRAKEASDDEVVDIFVGARVCLCGLKANAELNGKYGNVTAFDEAKRRWAVELEDGSRKLFKEANLTAGGRAQPKARQDATMGEHRKSFAWTTHQKSRQPAEERHEAGPSPPKPPPPPSMAQILAQVQVPQELLAPDDPSVQPAAAATREQREAAMLIEAGPEHEAAGRPLRPGAQVLVAGLESGEDVRLNGKAGVCELCDYAAGKWHVRFGDGSVAGLRQACLLERRPTLRPGAYVQVKDLADEAKRLNGLLGVCDQMDLASQRWSVRLDGMHGGWKLLKAENLVPQDCNPLSRPADDGPDLPGARMDKKIVNALEEALASGEISWLDC